MPLEAYSCVALRLMVMVMDTARKVSQLFSLEEDNTTHSLRGRSQMWQSVLGCE